MSRPVLRIAAILITIGIIFPALTSAYAAGVGQQVWARAYNGPARQKDKGVDVAVDRFKNVYVAAQIDNAEFDGDFAVIKYSRHGRRLWVRRYSGAGSDRPEVPVAIGVGGRGVYIAGYVETDQANDFQIVKYNLAGDLKWLRRFNAGGSGDDIVTAMAVNSKGEVYLAGGSDLKRGRGFDYLTIKYGPNGRRQWVKRYDGPAHREDYPNDLAIDGKGNAYVTGYSAGPGDSIKYLTLKYSRRGRLRWARTVGGAAANIAKAVTAGAGGEVFVTGTAYATGGAEYLTVKYGSNGTRKWTQRYAGFKPGSSAASGAVLSPDGGVYVSGESLDFASGRTDIAVLKYDASGRRAWTSIYGGRSELDYELAAIGADKDGSLYIAGMFESFERHSDIFAAKYTGGGELMWESAYAGEGDAEDRAGNLNVAGGFVYITGSTFSDGSENIITMKYGP